MKRLLGVVLVLFMACIPMNIHAQEVDLSFDYSGQKVEVENAVMYFTQSWERLDEAPIGSSNRLWYIYRMDKG